MKTNKKGIFKLFAAVFAALMCTFSVFVGSSVLAAGEANKATTTGSVSVVMSDVSDEVMKMVDADVDVIVNGTVKHTFTFSSATTADDNATYPLGAITADDFIVSTGSTGVAKVEFKVTNNTAVDGVIIQADAVRSDDTATTGVLGNCVISDASTAVVEVAKNADTTFTYTFTCDKVGWAVAANRPAFNNEYVIALSVKVA